MEQRGQVTEEARKVTCDDCFFRRADLCALPGNTPCPTFRPAAKSELRATPPPPPRERSRAVAAAA